MSSSFVLSMRLPRRLAMVFTIATVVASGSAYAQAERPERPYRGLFGGGEGALEQQLSVSGSLGTGWDSNLLADALGRRGTGVPRVSDFNTTHRGLMGTGSASLGYTFNRDRWAARMSGGTWARYYPSLATNFVRRESASASVSGDLGKGFTAGARASYQPYSLASMFPILSDTPAGGVPPVDEDFAFSSEHYVSYGGDVAYSHQLSRRTSLSLDAASRVRESSARDTKFIGLGAGGALTHSLTRDLSLKLGYHYAQGRYFGSGLRPANHVIDAGVDYHHALSVTRRTMVSFSTGTSAVTSRLSSRTRFRAIGSAVLSHEMGRTWYASLAYNRGVIFVDSWPEPVFSDAATAGLGGLLTRRLQVSASARAASGSVGFDAQGTKRFQTYYGTTGLTFALSRFVNTGLTYAYYNHRFADSVLLAPGFPHHLERQSVRAYVSLWAPLFERARRR